MRKEIVSNDGRRFRQISRWLKVRTDVVTPRHEMYDFADDGTLTWFMCSGVRYALGQFMRLDKPIECGDVTIAGYDGLGYYLLIEISADGEHVRLWEEC